MDTSARQIWDSTQDLLQALVTPETYKLWFGTIQARSLEGGVLTLEVPNEFCELWIEKNYLDLIQEKLVIVTGEPLQVRFVVGSLAATAVTAVLAPLPLAPAEVKAPVELEDRTPVRIDCHLNPRNTFDTFVVGTNNQFAHSAALAVAQVPGKSYNPLFLYGGVGLGKTHLLHAIGQHVIAHRKGARVAYLSSEKFTNEFIDAIQNNQLFRFRKKYRQTDVLLIDDIQFLTGKERIQEEFFHTFNSLRETHKQIVMTCDRPPGELQGIEQRLISRFEWGLCTDLQPPDVETRMAILKKKAALMNVSLPEDIFNFIALRIRTNVRRLEGALTRVASYATLVGKTLTLEIAENLLRETLHEEGRFAISIELIQKRVAEHFDIRIADMTSKRRPEHIAFPRQVAMFLSRSLTESSLNTIGEAFGGRDHGTVLHACRLVKDRMDVDANVRQVVSYLEKQLTR